MPSSERNNQNIFLWAVVAFIPFVFMSVSYIIDPWTWGLMDDTGFLDQKGAWWTLAINNFHGLIAWGTFRPTYALYTAVFYPLFQNAPKLFYFFKMILMASTLMLWGLNARLLTGKPVAQFLLPAITLSYYFYYDSFKYLSSQEPLGLFFLGGALWCFIVTGILPAEQKKTIHGGWLFTGFILLVICVFCKEVFVTSALGLAGILFLTSFIYKNRPLRWLGILLFLLALAYAIYLKCWFQHGYSSSYSLTDMGKISWDIRDWLARSFVFHVPWIFLMLVFGASRLIKREPIALDKRGAIGLALGMTFYILFLIALLPWQVSDFYAIPLGIFFAFMATLILAEDLEKCDGWLMKIIILLTLVFNISVCYCSFGNMIAYRNDTIQLLDWLTYNHDFHTAMDQGWGVATNAWEAGDKIPTLLEIRTGIKIPVFPFVPSVKDVVFTPRTLYYLYNSSQGDQDLRIIKQLYSVVFSSRTWTLFERTIPQS